MATLFSISQLIIMSKNAHICHFKVYYYHKTSLRPPGYSLNWYVVERTSISFYIPVEFLEAMNVFLSPRCIVDERQDCCKTYDWHVKGGKKHVILKVIILVLVTLWDVQAVRLKPNYMVLQGIDFSLHFTVATEATVRIVVFEP